MSDLAERLKVLSPKQRALLLRRLNQESGDVARSRIPALPRASSAFELSFAQQRLWFLDQLEPGSPWYNMTIALRLAGLLDPGRLAASLTAVVARHEALRTTFALDGDRAVQVIGPPPPVPLPLVDLAALPAERREVELADLLAAEARRPFDLTRGPLLRVCLFRGEAGEHALVLNMHHIVSDGWSVGILVREVAAFYEAGIGREASALPPLAVQYADFAAWQRRFLAGEVLAEHLAYWRRRLAGAPGLCELPTDRPRPAVQSFRGATHAVRLSAALTAGLRSFSQRLGATPFMTLLAAFQALLARSSRQEDVVVGSPVANRNRREIEGLIGFFVNTLLFRTDLAGDPTFGDLMTRVQEVAAGAFAHQDLPFEALVEELHPERQLSHNPLFQVLLVLQNAPLPELSIAGLTFSHLEAPSGTSKFDLSLYLWEGEALSGFLELNTDLFDRATAARFGDQLLRLLEGALAHPERALSALPLLADGQRHQLLAELAPGPEASPAATCLHRLFAAQAARTPEATALVAGVERLTYRGLDRRSDRLAHELRALGVGPEVLVGICLRRTAEMVVALLAVLKAGGAYVPLDPDYPKARLRFLLDDTRAPVLVSQRSLSIALPALPAATRVVLVDDDRPAAASLPAPLPDRSEPAGLAYVIYTSGSTGRPKGVAIAHSSAAAFVAWAVAAFPAADLAGVLASTSICFDLSIFEIFVPLACGGTVILAEDALELPTLTAAGEVTLVNTVPSAIHELVRLAALPPGVRTLNLAGEPLRRTLVDQLHERASALRVLNLYGPTEDTTYSTFARVERGGDRVTIGRPVAGTRAYVIDDRLEPVPIGIPGQLALAGEGLARGYLGGPRRTARSFLPDPFGERPGGRLYPTGDLARWLPDGSLDFLGRIDHQVKVHGFRIELGEIELALSAHPSIAEAVVTTGTDAAGEARLEAYVVQSEARDEPGEDTAAQRAEHVEQWRALYDETYSHLGGLDDPTFNVVGWNSSYTGEPLPAADMHAWVDSTVERIRARGASRILEIGCGTGLLLFPLAPGCALYRGSDFSRAAVAYLRAQLAGRDLPQVEIELRAADDFSGWTPGSFDLVVLNSVVQYFPDVDYLVRVLAGAARMLAPGGAVFLGDVRSLPLLPAFAASLELAEAPDSSSVADLRQRVRKRVREEEELVLDPAFFAALERRLPEIGRARLLLKRGRYLNELSRFRYDVFLEPMSGPAPTPDLVLDWEGRALTLAAVRRLLSERAPAALELRGVPNARVRSAARTARLIDSPEAPATCGELRAAARETATAAVDVEPEDLWSLGDGSPYAVEVSWSAAAGEGACDVFLRCAANGAVPVAVPRRPGAKTVERPWSTFASRPLHGQFARRLVPRLRAFLGERLPEHMMPAAFVLLQSLPLTPNGKLDRAALVPPDRARPRLGAAYAAPRSPAEAALAEIWSELLASERIGVRDSFFELGGHSLLGVRLMARIRARFGRDLPLGTLFQRPTIERLAELLSSPDAATARSALVPLQPGGSRRPFFCVHPVGGSVFCYAALARALGPDQPCYALQAADGASAGAPASLEDMARSYLDELRTVQPGGPYRLGGWSMGAVVAFEMAQQLRRLGEEVEVLALIDAFAPAGVGGSGGMGGIGGSGLEELDEATLRAWFARDLGGLLGRGGLAPIELDRLDATAPVEEVFAEAQRLGLLPAEFDFAEASRLLDVFRTNLGLLRRYRAQPYPGDLVLFRAAEALWGEPADPAFGWRALASGVAVHVVPGNHYTILQAPLLAGLAERLRGRLDGAGSTPAITVPPMETTT